MRFLFAITSEDSHFYSMPPLAWSLMSSGHEVQVASQPELEKSVTKAGLTCVPIGRDHKMWSFIERGVGDSRKKTETHSKIFEYADCPEEEATWDVLRSGFESIVPWGFRFVNDPMIRPLVDYCRYWKPDMVVWEPSTFAGAIAAEACGAAHARITWGLDFHGRLRDRYLRLKAAR
ncbi:hypothetical protein MRI28_31900, partial [Nocardiopsis dassonvillei]|nr:hypothetical protein [Nocardiopsis dassonvillei]